jgi:hypothetical protein
MTGSYVVVNPIWTLTWNLPVGSGVIVFTYGSACGTAYPPMAPSAEALDHHCVSAARAGSVVGFAECVGKQYASDEGGERGWRGGRRT